MATAEMAPPAVVTERSLPLESLRLPVAKETASSEVVKVTAEPLVRRILSPAAEVDVAAVVLGHLAGDGRRRLGLAGSGLGHPPRWLGRHHLGHSPFFAKLTQNQ